MKRERPVLLEAAINEGVTRSQHRFVPVTPDECAQDAIRSVSAGASFAHWHAADLAAYAEAWRAMRAADILAYPTYPNDPPGDVEARLGHCFALIEEHGLEMAPLDLGTAPTVFFDGERLSGGGTLANPLAFLERAAARYRALGAIPNLASFDLGHTRFAVALARTGILKPPLLLKLYLSDAWLIGPRDSGAAAASGSVSATTPGSFRTSATPNGSSGPFAGSRRADGVSPAPRRSAPSSDPIPLHPAPDWPGGIESLASRRTGRPAAA